MKAFSTVRNILLLCATSLVLTSCTAEVGTLCSLCLIAIGLVVVVLVDKELKKGQEEGRKNDSGVIIAVGLIVAAFLLVVLFSGKVAPGIGKVAMIIGAACYLAILVLLYLKNKKNGRSIR